MPTIAMRILGGAELQAALKALPDAVRGPAASRAIQPAAQLVFDSALERIPARSDEQLRYSLFTEESLADERGAEWVVGTEKRAGWYAPFVEFGTAPHEEHRGSYVHPGAGPRPFLRPAMDINQDAIVQLIGQGIAEALEASRA